VACLLALSLAVMLALRTLVASEVMVPMKAALWVVDVELVVGMMVAVTTFLEPEMCIVKRSAKINHINRRARFL
jgi:hypothetical protein